MDNGDMTTSTFFFRCRSCASVVLVHLLALLLAIVVTGVVNLTTISLMSDYDTIR